MPAMSAAQENASKLALKEFNDLLAEATAKK
jgi:hypothetical protein